MCMVPLPLPSFSASCYYSMFLFTPFLCQDVLPVLKWVRGEPLSQDHWLDLFRMLGMPKGTTLEKLTFGNIIAHADAIVANADALKASAAFVMWLILQSIVAS